MAQVLWRTGNWNGINTDTATSINTICPNADGSNNSQGAGGASVLGCWSDKIPRGQRFQWEITVSGGCSAAPQGIFTYTAFTMGIGIAGISSDGFSNIRKLSASGGTQANPPGPYTFACFSYNKSMTIGSVPVGGGTIVAAAPGNPANTIFRNGSIVTIDWDDIGKSIQFYVDGVAQWGRFNTGGFRDTDNIYVLLQTWSGGRPQAKLNDGTRALAHPVSGVQTLQQAISGGGTVITPPPQPDPNAITTIRTTVIPPAVTSGVAYSFQAVADKPFRSTADVYWSSQISTNPQSFINSATGVSVTLSPDKLTATISGITSGSTVPHTAYVKDGLSGTISPGTVYTVTTATTPPPSATSIAVDNPAFAFSSENWYGPNGRA